MALRFGDMVLIEVPFHQMQGSKVRPAAVVLDAGDEDFCWRTDYIPTGSRRVRFAAAGLEKRRLERAVNRQDS
jgi:hypothetical protein